MEPVWPIVVRPEINRFLCNIGYCLVMSNGHHDVLKAMAYLFSIYLSFVNTKCIRKPMHRCTSATLLSSGYHHYRSRRWIIFLWISNFLISKAFHPCRLQFLNISTTPWSWILIIQPLVKQDCRKCHFGEITIRIHQLLKLLKKKKKKNYMHNLKMYGTFFNYTTAQIKQAGICAHTSPHKLTGVYK